MTKRLVFLLAAGLVMAAASLATAQTSGGDTFYVNDPKNRNNITFSSEAPLEDIVGVSHAVTGMIAFDPMNPDKGGHAELSLSASSFTTGIPMRDEHLAGEPWLYAEKHPEITLKVTKVNSIKSVKKGDGMETFNANVTADVNIRGTTKPVTFDARITYLKESEMTKAKMDGDLLAVRAEFDVALADFGIKGPKGSGLVGTKVGQTVHVAISVMGSTAATLPGDASAK